MDTKRFAIGTLVGAVVLMVAAYVLFELLFKSFFMANVGSATGVDRPEPIYWAIAAGMLAQAALIVYVMGTRGEAWTVSRGAMVGAVASFLLWAAADFTMYGISNVANLARTVVDPLLELVHGAIGGAAIAAVIGKRE
jgi:hypothetical protein